MPAFILKCFKLWVNFLAINAVFEFDRRRRAPEGDHFVREPFRKSLPHIAGMALLDLPIYFVLAYPLTQFFKWLFSLL